jgi:hypothetical protein
MRHNTSAPRIAPLTATATLFRATKSPNLLDTVGSLPILLIGMVAGAAAASAPPLSKHHKKLFRWAARTLTAR